MFSSHLTAAAEFPNDNPSLHYGARWVCRDTRGAARAVLRASGEGAPPARAGSPPLAAPPERASSAEAPLERSVRSYSGPLQLDLERIVIAHRVENVPPPPDFIFRPFVRSSPAARAAELQDLVPIRPRPCQVVEAQQRVRRTGPVDIAPCLSVVESAPPTAPAAIAERPRRSRRRGPPAVRALAVAPLPDRGELQRAIAELEAAFAKPGLHCRPQCPASAI